MNPNTYHFDITPHIVKQLGEQLVTDEITALLELIKNSYDADASYVSIDINTTGKFYKENLFYPDHTGFIVIEDDGFGMSEETIMKSWLTISYSHKRELKDNKGVTKAGRTPLGDKGLGRLSTQRLADICEIFTNEEDREGVHIAFNWKDFEKEAALSDVKIKAESFQPRKKRGTTLVLTNINNSEVWDGKRLESFNGQLLQVVSPYEIETGENRKTPFKVILSVNGQIIDLKKVRNEFVDLSISRFEFEFDGTKVIIKGKNKLTKFLSNGIKSKDEFHEFVELDQGKRLLEFLKSKLPDLKLAASPYFIEFERTLNYESLSLEIYNGEIANPGIFKGQINEFSYNEDQLNNEEKVINTFSKFAQYKEFAKAQAGIKIYRNGFAVLPYGISDKNKDWLGLSSSQTKTSFYDLRPDNVAGYIALDESKNFELKDKTDRSGLISNPYSRNFFTLIDAIKNHINIHQRAIRKNYVIFINNNKTKDNEIKTVGQAFEQIEKTKAMADEVSNSIRESTILFNNAIDKSSKIISEINSNPLFSTESENAIANQVEKLLHDLHSIQITLVNVERVIARAEKLNEVVDVLDSKIQALEEQLVNFSELAGLGLTAESISHEFSSIADRLAEKAAFYSNKLQNKKLSDSDIYILMEYINTTVNGLKAQLKHLDPTLRYNKEKKAIFKLSDFFMEEHEYYKNRFTNQQITFDIITEHDFSIAINKGKLIQVIDNILNNSEYWLLEKRKKHPNSMALITVKIDYPWLYLYDNGYGISPAVESLIFEPFVTTKPKGEGRGLGLFIIQQLLDTSGCTISLEPTLNKDGQKYIFGLNLSNIVVN